MSQEKAHEFIRKTGTGNSFLDILSSLKSEEDLLNVAKSLGYDFTMEELRVAIVRIMDLNDRDLNDSDLNAVTGGVEIFGHGLLSFISLLSAKSTNGPRNPRE